MRSTRTPGIPWLVDDGVLMEVSRKAIELMKRNHEIVFHLRGHYDICMKIHA